MNHIRRGPLVPTAALLSLLLALLAALLVPATAHAVEVPSEATEVRIPLVLSTTGGAVAGGEIEFVYSEGLVYTGYQPAGGLENPVGTQIDGKTYAGFFAQDNRFEPVDGRISFGNLVFEYAGSEPQSITITEIDLHRTTSLGGVDSQRTTTSTVIPVTRAQAGTGTNDNNPSSPGNNNNNPVYPGTPAGTGTPGAAVVPVSAQSGGGGAETEAVELSAESGAVRSTPRASIFNQNTEIAEDAVPLAGVATALGLPAWALLCLVLAALAVLAAVFFVIFLIRRSRRYAAEIQSACSPIDKSNNQGG